MNVAVVEAIATDDDDRVADLPPRLHELALLGILEVEQEHHFVTQFAHVDFCGVLTASHQCFDLLARWPRNY